MNQSPDNSRLRQFDEQRLRAFMHDAPEHVARPTVREWVRHVTFFLLTILATLFAGAMLAADRESQQFDVQMPAPHANIELLTYLPIYYLKSVYALAAFAFANPYFIGQGALFSLSLLAILLAHEAGHYIACRYYKVNATLPYFIPAPPLFLAGTFGAFIKVRSAIPSRRALFDIAVAGPIAGFVVCVPVAFLALLYAVPLLPVQPTSDEMGVLILNKPLLFQLMERLFNGLPDDFANPFFFAAWFGLIVTSLNLFPVGHLDGGHTIYALLGKWWHKRLGILSFVVVTALAVLGYVWHGVPSGALYAVLLLFMLRLPHPHPENEFDELGWGRKALAVLVLLIFLLSFLPFPMTLV